MNEQFLRKINSIIIVSIFCLAIFVPFIMGVIEEDKSLSAIENRTLSAYPKTPQNIADIEGFPEAFENYYSDHFGFRDWFTEYYKLAKYNIGDSPSKDVTIGKNGWLFLGSIKKGYREYSDPIGDARNLNLYTQEKLEEFSQRIKSRHAWLGMRGIAYIFVIAPNKHTIYFDQLPNYIVKANDRSATDQAIDYLEKHTSVPVVDLREPLIREKRKHQIYNKTGTHWNHYAGNVAQYEIMKAIQEIFPDKLTAELLPDNRFETIENRDRGLERLSGISLSETPLVPSPTWEGFCKPEVQIRDNTGNRIFTTTCEGNELDTVIFRDSFFEILMSYFTMKFRRATYISGKLNYPSLIKYLELENPDVVIEEWVERNLPYVPPIIDEFLELN